MAAAEFAAGLGALGYTVERLPVGYAFDYIVPLGRHAGTTIKLGFQVGNDWPNNPPTGPHVNPHLLTIGAAGTYHPNGGVHNSPFGTDWQYWSRPFRLGRSWADTDRSVSTYMRFIANLFATL